MSSFNHIEKVSYTKVNEEPVSLIEYIVFTDERHEKKQVIFKLRNNLNQILTAIKINVYQYDENDNLIEKSLLAYNGFTAKAQELFVPNAKFDLNYQTKTIEVNLEYALFERLTWEDKKLNVIPYTRKDFDTEFTKENTKCKEEKEAKIKAAKINKGKRVTTAKNIIKRNVPKGPRIFATILSVLLLVFVFASAIYSRIMIVEFSDETFEYSKEDNQVTIEKFIGTGKNVVIPNEISGMKIIAIAPEAFKGSEIETVKFESEDLIIGREAFKDCTKLVKISDYNSVAVINSNAFENCDSLTIVNFPNVSSVSKNAFKSCDLLKNVNMPNANLNTLSFAECYSVTKLIFDSTTVNKLMYLFTDGYDDVEINLVEVESDMEIINSGFFTSCSKVKSVSFTNPDVVFEYGSLQGTSLGNEYTDNGVYEIFNGEIISYNLQSNKVIFDYGYTEKDIEKIFGLISLNRIKDVVVNTDLITVNEEFLEQFPNINRLEVGKNVAFEISSKSNLFKNGINTLSLDASFDGLNEYVSESGITNLELTGNGSISYELLAGLGQIKSLKIASTINRIDNNSLIDLISLEELQIPNFANKTLRDYGVSDTLKTLTIVKNLFNNSILYNDFVSDYPRLTTINFGSDTESFKITEIRANFISNCPRITKFIVPDTVIKLENGFIGYGCSGLIEVSVPFVGVTKNNPGAYCDLNLSYEYTNSLTITQDVIVDKYFSENLGYLDKLIFKGNIRSFEDGCFNGLQNINYLEFATSSKVSAFSDYFTSFGTSINTLILRNCEFTNEVDNLFSNVFIDNIVILQSNSLPENMFDSLSEYPQIIYIGDINLDNVNYESLNGRVNKLYFKGEIPEGLTFEYGLIYGNTDIKDLHLLK